MGISSSSDEPVHEERNTSPAPATAPAPAQVAHATPAATSSTSSTSSTSKASAAPSAAQESASGADDPFVYDRLGQLFLVYGDITRLACDAWLVPANRDMTIQAEWMAGVSGYDPPASVPESWRYGHELCCKAPLAAGAAPRALREPWLVNLFGLENLSDGTEAANFIERLIRYAVPAVVRDLLAGGRRPHGRRSRFLVLLPVLGVSEGTHAHIAGGLIERLVLSLVDLAASTGADVALVTPRESMHAALQATRTRTFEKRPDIAWPSLFRGLTPAQVHAMDTKTAELVAHSQSGNLALFIGAGASVGAGLPLWGALLNQLCGDVGLAPDVLSGLSSDLDKAKVLEQRFARPARDAERAAAAAAAANERIVTPPRKYARPLADFAAEAAQASTHATASKAASAAGTPSSTRTDGPSPTPRLNAASAAASPRATPRSASGAAGAAFPASAPVAPRFGSLGAAVAAKLETSAYPLTHALLAALGACEVLTTNYDTLYEEACVAMGVDVAGFAGARPPRGDGSARFAMAVLPHAPLPGCERWLLKLHGCVSDPDSIVLSRDHYIKYAERRAALAGMAQTALMTRHVLFCGFGLQDDNFHLIASDVAASRRAEEAQDAPGAYETNETALSQRFGTSLHLLHSGPLAELWQTDIDLLSFATLPPGKVADATYDAYNAAAGARLQVYLDYLVSRLTVSASYLLDPTFDSIMTPQEMTLRGLVTHMYDRIPLAVRQPQLASWRTLVELHRRISGGRAPPPPPAGPCPPVQFARCESCAVVGPLITGNCKRNQAHKLTPVALTGLAPAVLQPALDALLADGPARAPGERGHVFVARGDLTSLLCDSWLVSSFGSEDHLICNDFWFPTAAWDACSNPLPPGLPRDNCVVRVRQLLESADHGQPWAGDCSPSPKHMRVFSNEGDSKLNYVLLTVAQFFRTVARHHGHYAQPERDAETGALFDVDAAAARAAGAHVPRYGRARHLIALPVVTTGYGGSRYRLGEVLFGLLHLCLRAAAIYGYDVVLVCRDSWENEASRSVTFAAASLVRARLLADPALADYVDEPLSNTLASAADELGATFAHEKTVLLLGTALNRQLPFGGLVRNVLLDFAREIGTDSFSHTELDYLAGLSDADLFRVLVSRGYARDEIVRRVQDALAYPHGPMLHWMLASLTPAAVVTACVDALYERAVEGQQRATVLLPYKALYPKRETGRVKPRHAANVVQVEPDSWLLKLQGDVFHPYDLAILAEDTARARRETSALAVAQAALITNRAVLVGLAPEDTSRAGLLASAKSTIPPERLHTFGTLVALEPGPCLADLWHPEFHLVDLAADASADEAGTAATMRLAELFFDAVNARAQRESPVHLLDQGMLSACSEDERILAAAVQWLTRNLTDDLLKLTACRWVKDAIRQLGGAYGEKLHYAL